MKERSQGKANLFLASVALIGAGLYAFSLHYYLSEVFLLSQRTEAVVIILLLLLYGGTVFLHFQRKRNCVSKNSHKGILYLFASGIMPSILLFHYAAQNPDNFGFLDCLLLSIVLGFFSVSLFLLLSAKGDPCLSIVTLLIIWVLFWMYPSVINSYPSKLFFWLLFLVILGLSIYFVFRFHIDDLTGVVFSGVVCLLFLYNFGSALVQTQKASWNDEVPYQIKSSFYINESTAHPDIYWLHMDGMMGFDTIESFWGDPQTELKDNLIERGFLLNSDASLDIGWTAYAIPALTSPVFYDSYLKAVMDNMQGMTDWERKGELGTSFSIYDTYSELELFSAFYQAGYNIYHILNDIGRSFESISISYAPEHDFSFSSKGNIVDLLANHSLFACWKKWLSGVISQLNDLPLTSPDYAEAIFDYVSDASNISIYYVEHYDWYLANNFEETLTYSAPKFVYIQNFLPHFPFRYNENGLPEETAYQHGMSLYLPQHRYSAKMMLGMVDRIIETNPDAVIIIQGDHGVHAFFRGELASQGFSDEQMLTMNFSTISAVRIPEKYGALTEPLNPLDISRYLVNHYVGEDNYDYLYYREEE